MINNLKLSTVDTNKFLNNLMVFLAPVGILYLTTVIGIISIPNHLISIKDLIPTQIALGGMILYVLNFCLDYLKKLRG